MADQTPAAALQGITDRDGRTCAWHGADGPSGAGWCRDETLVPQHRQGGMGGRGDKHRLSNVVWLDSVLNGLIETDAKWQAEAVARGIKIGGSEDPELAEITHAVHGRVLLKDDGTVVRVEVERWGS